MTYSEVISNFLISFPEFIEKAKLEETWWNPEKGDEPLLGVFFEDVVFPQMLESIKNKQNPELVKRLFEYFEDLIKAPVPFIREELRTSIMEAFGNDKIILRKARDLMGPESIKLSHEAEKSLGRE
ncbi:hypothetical protein JP09_007870 [Dehalogenimonas etheniformans]|uniref:DUF7674 domain-containing protein n=2 Tax=Dehalogenimonas etheniformans TaxID=1536648 RepID=A0A2P5P5U1_9CHLR|nr:hypothetical protein [Dehalogenimonas etheniformans]PPD57649.1 hypothetical protein JP09_007870 [Dehalogenimonas etheniformans]